MRLFSLGRFLALATPAILLGAASAKAQPATPPEQPPAAEQPPAEPPEPPEPPGDSPTPNDGPAKPAEPGDETGAAEAAPPPPPSSGPVPPSIGPPLPPVGPPPPPLGPPPPLLPPPPPPATTAAVAAAAPPADGDLTIPITEQLTITPNGQYLLRYRHEEGKDFVDGGITNYFRHRARLGMEAMYAKRFGVFLQLQDVRTFGEETHTLFDYQADGFDLHQAYVRVLPVDQIEMRLGRQEIFFDNHRLIGTVGWLEQARSFDALRGIIKPDEMIALDVFYARTGEDHAETLLPNGTRAHMDDKDVIAANVHLSPLQELEASVTFMVDIDANDAVQMRKYTAGGMVSGKTDVGLSYGAEGYYQFGSADNDPAAGRDVTYSAWLVAARAQMDIDVATKPFVGAFGDFLSGDSDPADGTFRTFDVPYATNHKFYGEMDFFLNSVAHTQQRGLADLGGVVGFKPIDGGVAQITYHHFKAMAGRDGEIDAAGTETELDTFGNEVDFKLTYSPWEPLTFDWMYGFFVPGDIKRCMPGATGACTTPETKAEQFIYSTVSAKF